MVPAEMDCQEMECQDATRCLVEIARQWRYRVRIGNGPFYTWPSFSFVFCYFRFEAGLLSLFSFTTAAFVRREIGAMLIFAKLRS